MIGKNFGRWLVVEYAGVKLGNKMYTCKCKCGTIRLLAGYRLRKGVTKSCGCLSAELASVRNRRWPKGYERTLYSWEAMIDRCTNPNHLHYKDYGGRGILICNRWMEFENFLFDMGIKEKGFYIERIDNNGNYEPSNCKWATSLEQARNRRNTTFLTIDGITRPLTEWACISNVHYKTIHDRIKHGWDVKKAVFQSIEVYKNRPRVWDNH